MTRAEQVAVDANAFLAVNMVVERLNHVRIDEHTSDRVIRRIAEDLVKLVIESYKFSSLTQSETTK